MEKISLAFDNQFRNKFGMQQPSVFSSELLHVGKVVGMGQFRTQLVYGRNRNDPMISLELDETQAT